MGNTKVVTRSFAGGELSQSMFGRIDDAKYQSGAAVLENFIATPQGPAQNRPGFEYVINTKNNGIVKLIPFTFAVGSQTMALEFGVGYIRFHTQGQTVMDGDVPYEIVSPYQEVDLFALHYVQSADVMTIVQQSYPPMELRRLGPINWTLTPIDFGVAIATPVGVSATASPGYLAQISSITLANPAVITTAASHTLALGDGIYIAGLTVDFGGTPLDKSGFYLVNLVPTDVGTGDLIPNQLQVMDYSGNVLDASGWASYSLAPGTIQYGTKIYDINSYYAIAAVSADGSAQGLLSAEASALNNLNVPGSYNVITWTAVTGASRYYVYKRRNGLWGFIGEAVGTTFTDTNIAPDFSVTPINPDVPFPVGDPYPSHSYPAAVGYIEQRRVFAGTYNQPQNVWMTNSGTESEFSYSLPSKDTDRIAVKASSLQYAQIQHVVPLGQLLFLTGSCEYAEYTTSDAPITPSTIGIRPQSYIGASYVQPSVINNSLVYCAARGGHIREMGYNLQSNGYLTGDLSLRAAHLFDLLNITDQAFGKAPLPIVWFVSSGGNLLGLTYVPEQQIGAWHHHVTDGRFESICCVPEGPEDRLYATIVRNVNGQEVRFIERMATRLVGDLKDCFFVDAGKSFTSTTGPVTTISGLTWLEGKTVSVLADGAVMTQKVVSGGAITLEYPATTVQVGLPYHSILQTLPPVLQVDGYGQGRTMNLNKVYVRVFQSSGISAGPSEDMLTEFQQRTIEPYGSPPNLLDGQAEIVLLPEWNTDGQLIIRQDNPLPLTVVSVTIDLAVGGS